MEAAQPPVAAALPAVALSAVQPDGGQESEEEEPARQRLAVALALAPLPAVAFQFACSAAQRLVWVCPGFEAFPKAEEEQPEEYRASPQLWASIAASVLVI